MKKLFLFLLITLVYYKINAQVFSITIHNKTQVAFNLEDWQLNHGDKGASLVPGAIEPNDVVKCRFSPNFGTGVEGTLKFRPVNNNPNALLSVYYDNPFIGDAGYNAYIGSPFILRIISWKKDYHFLELEIGYAKSDNSVEEGITYSKTGIISGTIYWKKSDIDHPQTFPYYKAFEMKAYAPNRFGKSGAYTAGTKGKYNGVDGTFLGSDSVGRISYTIDNSDAEYDKIKYTATEMPVEVPVQFDIITNYDHYKWIPGVDKKTPPDNKSFFVVGTFPISNKAVYTLDNSVLRADGIDFTCEGDWVKPETNGDPTSSIDFQNKIQNRINSVTLPGGILTAARVNTKSNQMIQAPAVQNKAQQVQVQKVKTAGNVRF